MGSAAILQLAAYGAQDIYLTAEPQISYFKNIYKRHTPFAMEQIELPINGVISPGANVSIIISRNGDLLKGLWIQYNPSKLIKQSTKLDTIASDLSHALIDSLDIEIGDLHRIENIGSNDVIFIEVQTGTYFGEDDIERIEDDFGR